MRIKAVSLYTNDLDAVVHFYAGEMGFSLLAQSGTAASFKVGYSVLTFSKTNEMLPPYHFAFLVPQNLFMEAYSWAQSKKIVLPFSEENDIADFTNWNAQAFYFHDTVKNILEIITHYDLPHTGNQPFSTQSLIGICEIGLVVPHVAAACQQLEEQYSIPRFHKGPYLDDFAVMGGADGLLIISKEGRGWVPTGQLAQHAGGHVVVERSGAEVTIPI